MCVSVCGVLVCVSVCGVCGVCGVCVCNDKQTPEQDYESGLAINGEHL